MSKIAIFVSHRTDVDSVILDNPLFVPVLCGASELKEKKEMIGDNTGVNISDKKSTYSELTVQFWAWNNFEADYYGLCHYRRYFSFINKRFESNINLRYQVEEPRASNFSFGKYGLTDQELVKREIESNDLIVPEPWDVKEADIFGKTPKNVYQMWKLHEGVLIQKDCVDKLLSVVKEVTPEYYSEVNEYLEGQFAYSFNCHVMKRIYFKEFCSFEYSVLEELEKKLDLSMEGETQARTLGYMAEILFGSFIHKMTKDPQVRISRKQLVIFKETERNPKIIDNGECPLVVTCSDYYVPYLSSFIVSLSNVANKSRKYKIFVLNKNISKNSRQIIINQCSEIANIEVAFYRPYEELEGKTFYTANAVEESNYRMLAPWILKNFDKAIILDLDLVFKRDIADLYDSINFDEDTLIYAAKDIVYQGMLNGVDPDALKYSLEVMKMKAPYNYVNTGVMVFNLKGIREYVTRSKLLDFSLENKFRIQEQDLINVFYEGRIKFLDLRWNFYLETNNWVTTCIKCAPHDEGKKYYEAKKNPYILHYANVPKPWDAPGSVKSEEFWRNARSSQFYEVILYRTFQHWVVANSSGQYRASSLKRVLLRMFPEGTVGRKVFIKMFPQRSLRRKIVKFFIR